MNKVFAILAVASVIAGLASPALAEDQAMTNKEAAVFAAGQVTQQLSAANADTIDALFGSETETVTDANLGKANGKEAISLNAADLTSIHGGNQANNAVTGNANIGAGALSDINGTAAVVMNTGNNSVVQVSQQIIFNLY